MDWNAAIERNREALKRILASLVAMAGLAGATALTSPLCGLRGRSSDRASGSIVGREGRGDCEAIGVPGEIREASGGGGDLAITPTRRSDDCRPPLKGEVGPEFRPTLPRHLYRAVLRLLRPAEAAARRLIIVAARGMVVKLPPPRPRKPKPKSAIVRNGIGTGIVLPRGVRLQAGPSRTVPRTLSLPLLDPLRNPLRRYRRYVPAHAAPRIMFPGVIEPSSLPPPPSPDDPIDVTRLALRLSALGRVLDDLPGHASRFARWQARVAAGAQDRKSRAAGRIRRTWPLRPGRPPGSCRRPTHEVHEVLGDLQWFAFKALERPDTS